MENKSNARGVLIVVVPLALGAVLMFFILKDRNRTDPKPPDANQTVAVLGALTDFTLVDQNETEFGLDQLLGKVWIGTFIFTNCRETCPAQTRHMAQLQEQLRTSPQWERIHLVSITVDPNRDTPKVLREYATVNNADAKHWHFLTGPLDDVRALSVQGFKLAATGLGGDGPAHSSQLVLVDGWGLIRGYYEGTSPEALETLRSDLNKVIAEETIRGTPLSRSAAARSTDTQVGKALADIEWLRDWQRQQRKAAESWSVEHQFQFTDRLYSSGITFRNRVVDDAVKTYKGVHYDHGTGLAVADVDGDGLYDIYFVNQVGESQLWRNLGGGKFEDITAKAGVGLAEPIKVTATFVDVNNDGAPDLYVTTIRNGNRLLLNDGKGKFTDVTEGSGLGLVGHYSTAVFFDYDRDGLVDVFLCEVGKFTGETLRDVTTEPARGDQRKYQFYDGYEDAFAGHLKPERFGKCLLLRNTGNAKFVDVTDQVGLNPATWTGEATPLMVSPDGWPGLYVLNMQGHNQYFENQGGKKFVRRDRELFPKTPWGAMGVKAFDYNNDGLPDFLICDMHSDMSVEIGPDRMLEKKKSEVTWPETVLRSEGRSLYGNAHFEGLAGGKFQEVSDKTGVETYWPWGPSVGDLNADGFLDVFITSGMGYPYRYSINNVLLNDAGKKFIDAEFVLGVEPRRGWRIAKPWFELDANGVDAEHVDAKGHAGRITVWGTYSSRSSVIFDLDGDGDLDIVTNDFNSEPMILISNLTERKKIHYVQIKLQGGMTVDDKSNVPLTPASKSNRDGLGARVRVRCGDRSFVQVHDGRSGYLSQSSLPLYFGLGGADTIDEIEIAWPSGRKQTLTGPIKADRTMIVKEE